MRAVNVFNNFKSSREFVDYMENNPFESSIRFRDMELDKDDLVLQIDNHNKRYRIFRIIEKFGNENCKCKCVNANFDRKFIGQCCYLSQFSSAGDWKMYKVENNKDLIAMIL